MEFPQPIYQFSLCCLSNRMKKLVSTFIYQQLRVHRHTHIFCNLPAAVEETHFFYAVQQQRPFQHKGMQYARDVKAPWKRIKRFMVLHVR